MSTPFFSVVIPTYNSAEFLRKSVSSVLEQTNQDFEILVVDNNSTDHTDQVINDFKSDKIRVFKVNNDGVIGVSRNLGIKKALGQWVSFLDADDRWLPEKLEKMQRAIVTNIDCILICHDVFVIKSCKKNNVYKCGPYVSNMYERLLLKGNVLVTSAVTAKKNDLVLSGGFSEKNEYVTVEDYDLWLKLAQRGPFYFLSEVLGEYYIHDNSSSKRANEHAAAIIQVSRDHLLGSNYSQKKINKGLAKAYCIAGRALLESGNFRDVKEYALKSLGYNWFNLKAWAILLLGFLRIKI